MRAKQAAPILCILAAFGAASGALAETGQQPVKLGGKALELATTADSRMQAKIDGEILEEDAYIEVETAFDDVIAAAALCRFNDCSHEAEPDCGVRAALAAGTLDEERYISWRKLQGELLHLAMKQDSRLRAEARKERQRFARSQRKASW